MNDRKYTVALCCLTAVAVALILLIVWSMIVPNRAVQDPVDETNSATEADTSLIPDTTANDTTANTEADTEIDYTSFFYEGMVEMDMVNEISSAGFSTLTSWHMFFVTDESDTFCLIQLYNTPPDYPVSRVSIHTVQSPTEADLDSLVPGTPITEIVDVWGYPTESLPWSDFTIAEHRYDLADGRRVYLLYKYNKESGTYFFERYKIYE